MIDTLKNHRGRVVGLALLSFALAAPAVAQNVRLQRQSVPPPERPEAELVTPESARAQESMVCKGVQVFWTIRGLAFGCVDFQAGVSYTMVVDERQFPGGAAAAVVVLDRAARESRDYILDPQRPGVSLNVRFREPDARSRSVCQLLTAQATDGCREVIHFYD